MSFQDEHQVFTVDEYCLDRLADHNTLDDIIAESVDGHKQTATVHFAFDFANELINRLIAGAFVLPLRLKKVVLAVVFECSIYLFAVNLQRLRYFKRFYSSEVSQDLLEGIASILWF